ncbi:MAG TPA: PA0069 family radical SAM protein, partial [bacterium]|nr:PA0069 family radical SAM protein [bacterium]
MPAAAPRGRGSRFNPPNRFEKTWYEPDPDLTPEAVAIDGMDDEPLDPAPGTEFIPDFTRTIIATNDSPDVGFDASINPYRGCEHGCAYCFARPFHEYLGFSAGIDFETKIVVKERAPALLRAELTDRQWVPKVLALSGVTDCYQPAERRYRLTRGCLEVLAEFRNPVGIITKNALITRDVDLLAELAGFSAAAVTLSITTLDPQLHHDLEPRTSTPRGRLKAIEVLSAAGVNCSVNVAPLIPGLNDHEMPAILEAAARAGAKRAGWVPIRLPYAVAPLFVDWLERMRPDRKDKVINKIKAFRGGVLYRGDFFVRRQIEGEEMAMV